MDSARSIFRILRSFLFSWLNKEFLIFLFFLLLSGIFWLQLTLNESYEREFDIPITLTGVPQNVVLTSNESDTVKVTLSDKGLVLLGYLYTERLKAVKVNFKTYAKAGGNGTIPAADIQKLVYQQLSPSTKITQVKPDKTEFYYNYGLHKKVPVKWVGNVIPEKLYFISKVAYQPDSVDVYASQQRLDSITEVFTEPLNYTDFRDTLSVKTQLAIIRGAKIVPDATTVHFYTDVLTEESIEDIPIKGINLPPGKVLRTFPSKVNVKFVTGVNHFRRISKNDFTVVVDYNDLAKRPSDKCVLRLQKFPAGISRATLSIQQVDYLLEEE